MYNTIYSPVLDYESLSDNPQKELVYALDAALSDDSVDSRSNLSKCFGYIFELFDKSRMVLVCNGLTFEMDVIIQDRRVMILKGSFHELKMYLLAKLAKQLNINIQESELQYMKRKYESTLQFVFLNKNEVDHMMSILQLFRGTYTCSFAEALSIFRTKLNALINDTYTKEQMCSPLGFGVCLAKYLTEIRCEILSHDVTKLYLIQTLLKYELHENAKAYCRIALLDYQDYDTDYSEILCEIAEWIYSEYFNDKYRTDSEIDMDEMD